MIIDDSGPSLDELGQLNKDLDLGLDVSFLSSITFAVSRHSLSSLVSLIKHFKALGHSNLKAIPLYPAQAIKTWMLIVAYWRPNVSPEILKGAIGRFGDGLAFDARWAMNRLIVSGHGYTETEDSYKWFKTSLGSIPAANTKPLAKRNNQKKPATQGDVLRLRQKAPPLKRMSQDLLNIQDKGSVGFNKVSTTSLSSPSLPSVPYSKLIVPISQLSSSPPTLN